MAITRQGVGTSRNTMKPKLRRSPHAALPNSPEADVLRFTDEAVQAGVEGLHRRYEAGV